MKSLKDRAVEYMQKGLLRKEAMEESRADIEYEFSLVSDSEDGNIPLQMFEVQKIPVTHKGDLDLILYNEGGAILDEVTPVFDYDEK